MKIAKKNLILDCDGVLYPLAQLPTMRIVEAMKDVYRHELNLSGEQQRQISQKTIREQHLGMFNYVREMCRATGYDFDTFCRQMSKRIDYNTIEPNPSLWNTLQNVRNNYNIAVWSNGCRDHLDYVFSRVFAKDVAAVEQSGIPVFDITLLEKDGYFMPKQSQEGFGIFLHKTGFKADESILFDDTARNLTQAKKYGVSGVLVSDDKPLEGLLRPYLGTQHFKVNTYEKD